MHDKDFLSMQQQTGLQKIPQNAIDEYERVANMVCRDGLQLPLGPLAINDILRRCNLEGPTEQRPAEISVVDWRTVKPEVRVCVKHPLGEPRYGKMLRFKLNGCLDVLLDDDTAVREFAQRHCSLVQNYSDDPWAGVEPGRTVSVLRGLREYDAKFIAIEDAENVKVQFKTGEKVVPKNDVKLVA